MKKIKTLLIMVLTMFCSLSASAHDFEVDSIYYKISSDSTVYVTYKGLNEDSFFNEYAGEVIIPEKVTYNNKEYSVTSIGRCAFYECSGLTSVVIPNSVTSIGNSAFSGRSGLAKVNISDLSAWCKIKFDGSSSNPLNSGAKLYLNGTEITNLVIPDDVTTVNDYAFSGCSGLTSVIIPNSVTSIGSSAFYNCSNLPSITIPNSVTSIGSSAFYGCSGLTSVVIPNSVTSIGYSAFYGCTGELVVNCDIYSNAFRSSKFTSVIIGDSVTSIGYYAFSGCSGLTSVVIPNSVTSIGDSAFSGCTKLSGIKIPNSVTSIGYGAFSECESLKTMSIEDGEEMLKYRDNFLSTVDSLHLGRNLYPRLALVGGANIYSNYYRGESNLSVLSIGETVVALDDNMFYECNKLTKIISYAVEPPSLYSLTFPIDIYKKARLYVPVGSVEKYKNADIWKKFLSIEEIDNNANASKQCSVPIIKYTNGKLQFSCETEGAECKYAIIATDAHSAFVTAKDNSVELAACYEITAYAQADGYKNSEKVSATLYWVNGDDITTNINTTEMRGVVVTSANGIIIVSGLNESESVGFYTVDGTKLYGCVAQNGTASYAVGTNASVVIVTIGKSSMKVMVK